MRQKAFAPPRSGPYRSMASIAYWEQVGRYLQQPPSPGDKCRWYQRIILIIRRPIIGASIRRCRRCRRYRDRRGGRYRGIPGPGNGRDAQTRPLEQALHFRMDQPQIRLILRFPADQDQIVTGRNCPSICRKLSRSSRLIRLRRTLPPIFRLAVTPRAVAAAVYGADNAKPHNGRTHSVPACRPGKTHNSCAAVASASCLI